MKIKGIIDNDTTHYKEPSLTILCSECSMKCEDCPSKNLLTKEILDVNKDALCEQYLVNKNTKAVVIAGLEPFDTELDILPFINCFRNDYKCNDPIIIYTGYTEEELEAGYRDKNSSRALEETNFKCLKNYKNIIIKFGRHLTIKDSYIDPLLGVLLSSSNQYAKII